MNSHWASICDGVRQAAALALPGAPADDMDDATWMDPPADDGFDLGV